MTPAVIMYVYSYFFNKPDQQLLQIILILAE